MASKKNATAAPEEEGRAEVVAPHSEVGLTEEDGHTNASVGTAVLGVPPQDVQGQGGRAGAVAPHSEVVKRVYIGPSIAFSPLREGMILAGTEAELDDFTAGMRESYPEIPQLMVAPEELTEALEKVGKKGTILHKYYGDMLAKSRTKRTGQG